MKFIKKIIFFIIILLITNNLYLPKVSYAITAKQEEDMSHEYLKVIFKNFKIIKDPLIFEYINKVGQKIVQGFPAQNFKFQFYVINDDSYNAFATPAGHIFINSGLFENLDKEEELAGILAHEIAHVYCRHISERIERSKKIGIATIAGIVASIALGIAGVPAAASALNVGTLAAAQTASLSYSREDELQADQIGINYLQKAGYSGKGLLTSLNKIRSKQWFSSKDIPTYLNTHPASEERIAYISTWLASSLNKSDNVSNVSNDSVDGDDKEAQYDFNRVKIRLTALYGNKKNVIHKLKNLLKSNPDDPLLEYGYGLVLARNKKFDKAALEFKKALNKKPFDPYILCALGKVYFFKGEYKKSLKLLNNAISIIPYDVNAYFYIGRAQMELGNFKKAHKIFEKLLDINPNYKKAYYFLGKSHGKIGNMHNAHYNLGIYYKNIRQLKDAMFHLEKALKMTKDPKKREEIIKLISEINKNIALMYRKKSKKTVNKKKK